MATMDAKPNKNGTNIKIQFYLNKERKKLCLGSKYTIEQGNEIMLFVEKLVTSIETGARPSKATLGFLEEMTIDLRERFEKAGLIEVKRSITNAELWDRFLDETADLRKDSTRVTYVTVRKRFMAFFRPDASPSSITRRDGERWKSFLKAQGLSEASIAGSIQKSMAVFNWAVEQEYLESNPFRGIRRGSMRNPKRNFYVPMDWYEKLLDACPDQTWRTLLALCRIGGLRNPSETLLLTWADVDWVKRTLLVHSPKTEHHDGKDCRIIPLFPELRVELEKQFEQAEEGGSPYVIPKWRDTAANMRTHFQRIIFRAGFPVWERLFQNLRESRANDIAEQYPAHVESAWLGHSTKIAQDHYLIVTDSNFQRAIQETTRETTPFSETGGEFSKTGGEFGGD